MQVFEGRLPASNPAIAAAQGGVLMYVCIIVNGTVPIVLNVRLPQSIIDSVSAGTLNDVTYTLSLAFHAYLVYM